MIASFFSMIAFLLFLALAGAVGWFAVRPWVLRELRHDSQAKAQREESALYNDQSAAELDEFVHTALFNDTTEHMRGNQ